MFEHDRVWEFTMAGRVAFGEGAVEELPAAVRDRDASTVLLVTDPGVRDAGIVDHVVDNLGGAACDVYDGVEPDPSLAVYEDAVAHARDVEPDLVVGVGGGSSMDVAKTTGIVLEHGGEIMEYVAPPIGGGEPVPGPGVPVVCVPTTAGTGSETSPTTVVSLPDRETKVGISSRHQCPDLALVDPLLTVSLPPAPTASSGMDALAHAVEAYTTRRYDRKERPSAPAERPNYGGRTFVTDQFATAAIERIGGALRRAVYNGADVSARRDMLLGSLLAGVAFTNAGVTANHAMAMAIGGHLHTPHGVTVAVLLPESVRFNAASAPERFADVAALLGRDAPGDDAFAAAESAADAIERLAADVDVPDSLSALGVSADDVGALVEKTMAIQRLLVGNPRRMSSADVEAVIRRSL